MTQRVEDLRSERTGRRRAVAFGAALAGGALAMGSIAYACTPLVGYMEVQAYNASTQKVTGTASTTMGGGAGSMNFCGNSGSIKGGAQAGRSDLIKITLAPGDCPPAPYGAPDVNRLGKDDEATTGVINFHPKVFKIDSNGSYSYTHDGSNDCMTAHDKPEVIPGGDIAIVDGVGTAIVPVPPTLAKSTSLMSAGVCVDAYWVADSRTELNRGLSMAPLFVL